MLDHAASMVAEIRLDQLNLSKMVWIKLADGQKPRMAKPADGAEINGRFYKAFRPGDRFQQAA
jgi:hypothetical protein